MKEIVINSKNIMKVNYNKISNEYLKKYNINLLKPNKLEDCYACPNMGVIVAVKPSSKRQMRKFLHEVGHIVHPPNPIKYENNFIIEIKAESFAYNELISLGIKNKFIINKIYIHSSILSFLFGENITPYFNNVRIDNDNIHLRIYNEDKIIFNEKIVDVKERYNVYL